MSNPYTLLRRAAAVRSPRLKLIGAWLLAATGRRYVGVFLDPVLGCNLRCLMCYFSDPVRRAELHGRMTAEQLERLAARLFPRALKLQIGCGAEPTLYKALPEVVALGKKHGVPYVSITTNGQLLTDALLRELIAAGLDEVTLSLHGLTRATYEELMPGARFDRFEELCGALAAAKADSPALRIRLNYTMNSRNTAELALLPDLLQSLPADVVQLRPVQRIGDSAWQDFSTRAVRENYDSLLRPLATRLKEEGVTVLMPDVADLDALDTAPSPVEAALHRLTYLNVEPAAADVAAPPRLSLRELVRALLGRGQAASDARPTTKKLAYRIR